VADASQRPHRTVVYTDGACAGNPGPGGWAWAVPGGRYRSGASARTTNQRMEITAVLEAVRSLEGPLEVRSDSTYVVNCFRDRWWEGWLARGWLTAAKKPVANRDLWEPLITAYRADPSRLHFQWVKGHGGDPMNDLVDRLAVAAAAAQAGDEGVGQPAQLGPADRPGRRPPAARAPAGGRPPAGASASPTAAGGVPTSAPPARAADPAPLASHVVAVAGLRPPALGGYGDNPVAGGVRRRLTEIIDAQATMHPDTVVITGLGLGAEQLGAEAAELAGVPYVAVEAYPHQDQRWPAATRARYQELRRGAKEVVTLGKAPPTSKQAAGAALARRDAWLARNATEAVVVWDGDDPFVGKTVRSWRDRLGEERVWVIEPAP
jgi:ribonuclease HI/uncharacterized phage-like protein YoqJ